MKKTMIVLSAVLALVACNKVETEQPTAKEYTYDITITRADDTKAVKSAWENGDVVYVFFSNVAAPNYLKFTYNGTAWTRTQYNGATAESFTYPGNGTMTAIYLPYGNDAVVSADGTSFKFNKSYTSYYLKAEKAPYKVSGTVVSGTLSMEAPEGFVQFAMPMSGEVNSTATTFFRTTNPSNSQAITYTLSDSNIKPVSFTSVSADGTVSQDETAAAGAPITGYIYGGDINFSGVLSTTANGNAADYEFTFVNNNGTAETYDDVTYRLSGNKNLSYKDAIKFPAIIISNPEPGIISISPWKVPAPSYVEINGVKWATCNIGATAPEGYGDYFAWGATYPQAKYEYSDYRESSLGGNLSDANDVASLKLGSEWHMPTLDEIEKLLDTDKVTWSSWTTENGVNGYWVSDKVNEEQKIFLPAAGYWCDVELCDAGDLGIYWVTEYGTNSGFGLYFGDGYEYYYYYPRYYGQSVRPVHN